MYYTKYQVILKKVSFGKEFYYRKQRQMALSEQVVMTLAIVKFIKARHLLGHISQKYHASKIIFMQK